MEELKQEIATPVCAPARNDTEEREIAAIEEHAPVEVDPVAEAEKACQAMQEQLLAMTAEKENLKSALEKTALDLRNSQAATSQYRANAADMGKALKREQEGRVNDRKAYEMQINEIRKFVSKPITLPIILGAASGILALLVGVCIDQDLMTCMLGDPLGAGLLAICTLFAGVVYERLRLR